MSDSAREFSIHVEQNRDAATVRPAGEVDLHNSPQLRAKLHAMLDRRQTRIVIDLSQVSYMDSSGVGTIVEAKRRADREGAALVLAGMQPRVRSVFEITQLDKFFTILDDPEQAKQP